MKITDVLILGIMAAGAYYIFTNPDAMNQITSLIGGLGGGLGGLAPVGAEEDPCATECAAQTQAALAIGMDPEYFQFAYASKKQSKSQKNGKESNGGGEDEEAGGAVGKGAEDVAEEAGGGEEAEPTEEPAACDCSQYTAEPEATATTPGEDTGEADPMTGESSEPSEGGEEEEEDEEESSFARSYAGYRRRRRPNRFRAYSGYGYAHKYAGWGNGHRVQPGYVGFIPRVH